MNVETVHGQYSLPRTQSQYRFCIFGFGFQLWNARSPKTTTIFPYLSQRIFPRFIAARIAAGVQSFKPAASVVLILFISSSHF